MYATSKLNLALKEAAAMYDLLVEHCGAELDRISTTAASALRQGGKLLFAGNGGSAAESQHLATEFVVRLSADRDRNALAAIALMTDTSLLTACANDYGFEQVFARQVEALMKPEDVLFLLTTSGKSPNLIAAAKAAKKIGGKIVVFAGQSETPLDEYAKHSLRIPSASSQRVQEAHLLCGHLLVELVEDALLS